MRPIVFCRIALVYLYAGVSTPELEAQAFTAKAVVSTPIVGDWNGDGKAKIGVYAGGYWYLDYDGNYLWEHPAKDKIWALGWTGTAPAMGDWNGDGKTKAGAFINGYWYLDYNGNGLFDGSGADRIFAFGQAGDTPVVGRW